MIVNWQALFAGPNCANSTWCWLQRIGRSNVQLRVAAAEPHTTVKPSAGEKGAPFSCAAVSQRISSQSLIIHAVLVLAGSFDFNTYMGERAKLVNKALDESLPQRYPDVLLESMR